MRSSCYSDDSDTDEEQHDYCMYEEDEEDDYGVYEEDNDEFRKTENFAVVTVEEIEKRLDDDVSTVCSLLSIEKEVAISLLIRFNWNLTADLTAVSAEWLTDEERIRKEIGLGLFSSGSPPDFDMENEKKYRNNVMRSYVENHKNLKWCPAPDCDNAVEYISGKSENFNVKCSCSCSFCWSCLEEIHRPADCETVAKWKCRNRNHEEIKILAPTWKPCPQCKKPIERNRIFMRMICGAPCLHEFCWLCLDPWEKHKRSGSGSGSVSGFYSCSNKLTEEERCTRSFETWAAKEASRRKSLLLYLEESKSGRGIQDFDYIINAWEQVIECTRVLKWAYVYGYYIPVEKKDKKVFFEFLQGEAEAGLERLHECAEELTRYADANNGPVPNFMNSEDKLRRMTQVTRNYFDRFVRALENPSFGDVSIDPLRYTGPSYEGTTSF